MNNTNLTLRQRQAVKALIESDNQDQAASVLEITPNTYRCLLLRARQAAGVTTNEQLVYRFAREEISHRLGIILPSE